MYVLRIMPRGFFVQLKSVEFVEKQQLGNKTVKICVKIGFVTKYGMETILFLYRVGYTGFYIGWT